MCLSINFLFFLSFYLGFCVIKQVIDGEKGSERRRELLPSYKAHRKKFLRHLSFPQKNSKGHVGRSHQVITDVLGKCNVPVSFFFFFSIIVIIFLFYILDLLLYDFYFLKSNMLCWSTFIIFSEAYSIVKCVYHSSMAVTPEGVKVKTCFIL